MKKKFNKSENFTGLYFYKIYYRDGVKYIKFIGFNPDLFLPEHSYATWSLTFYDDETEMPIESFLEWNRPYYQLEKLLENSHYISEIDIDPNYCLEQTNLWVIGDGNGSEHRNILKITETIPEGYYYGY